MATFTIALKNALEIVQATPENNYRPIGLADYPIFDADYRDELNKKIIERYWNREIGMETIDMFTFALRRKMNEIMPYYNQLYETEKLIHDPLSTMDITTTAKSLVDEGATSSGINNSTNDSTSGSRSVNSSTPQTMLSGNEDYAESAADVNSQSAVTSESNQSNETTGQTNTNADSHVSGYQGIPGNILMAYRASLLNIDMMVLTDLEELFMLIWDTGDEYTNNRLLPFNSYILGV